MNGRMTTALAKALELFQSRELLRWLLNVL